MALTVLIVDDSEVNQKLLTKFIEQKYNLLYAKNGEEALCLLGEKGAEISAVLLDMVMPVMDGYEVLKRMRANPRWFEIPVIVTTTLSDRKTRENVTALGASGFIPKPYEQAVILKTLQSIARVSGFNKDERQRGKQEKNVQEAGMEMSKSDYIRMISLRGDIYGGKKGTLDLLLWCNKMNLLGVTEEEARPFWEDPESPYLLNAQEIPV